MKKNIIKKLILSVSSLAATAVCLTSTTYAWFAKNATAWADLFSIDIEVPEGLLISIDGENYKQDLTSDDVKTSIAGTPEAFNKLKFSGVTPLQDQNNKIDYDDETHEVKFGADVIDEHSGKHEYVAARVNKDYIKFHVWLQGTSKKFSPDDLMITVGDNTVVNAETKKVPLLTGFTVGSKTYQAGEEISINLANAIRLGFYSHNETENKFKIFEVVDEETDLGTTAIEGKTDEHNPENNIMYNYYNAIFPLSPFEQAATWGEAYQTKTRYGQSTDDGWMGEFVTGVNQQGIAEVDIYLWLEGWDADYLLNPLDPNMKASEINATIAFALEAKV